MSISVMSTSAISTATPPRSARTVRLGLNAACALLVATFTVTFALPLAAQPPGDLMLVDFVDGLNRPVAIRNASDGTNRLFVVEQAGRILVVQNGAVLATPFLDIQNRVDDGGNEQGLLGLAFHPNYQNNGLFYVNYTRDPGPGLDRTIVEQYTVSGGNPNVANAGSGTTIIEIEQDFSNHNGGDIHFGPDGFLYLGMGDGGSGNDPNDRSQDPLELLGKMLRIDVSANRAGAPEGGESCGLVGNYGIPQSNPFAGNDGTCDEIWALGVRNPWRWSFDRLTGDMWIGDVGQGPNNAREEIDFQPANSGGGENYGWSCMEGTQTPNYNSCLPGPLTNPVMEYTHSVGNSIAGGYRYRGSIAGMRGLYWFADSGSGRIWWAQETSPGNFAFTQWADTSQAIVSFGEDEQGELYVVNLLGGVDRFVSASGTIFSDGFETGDLSAWDATVP